MVSLERRSSAGPAYRHRSISALGLGRKGLLALDSNDLSPYCEVLREYSSLALAKLAANAKSFDLIYIDGSHLFEDVFVDVYYSVRLLRGGGMILLDDASNPHVAKVIQFIRTNMRHALRRTLKPFAPRRGGASRLKYHVARAVGRVQLAAFQRIGDPVRRWDTAFSAF